MTEEKEIFVQSEGNENLVNQAVENDGLIENNTVLSQPVQFVEPVQVVTESVQPVAPVQPVVEVVNPVSSMDPVQSVEPTSNGALYSTTPAQYVTEQSVGVPMQSESLETQSLPIAPILEGVKTEAPVEVGVNPTQSVESNEKVVSKLNKEMMDQDLKGNLTFIIVLAIIMIAMIVALPYISGI